MAKITREDGLWLVRSKHDYPKWSPLLTWALVMYLWVVIKEKKNQKYGIMPCAHNKRNKYENT